MASYLHNWRDQFRGGPTRREFLAIALIGARRLRAASAPPRDDDLWTTADAIVRRIRAPVFPSRTFDITKYGAKPDGSTDCSSAFRAAIAACHDAGGGRVIVPNGRFLTGAIRLRSKVDLHLDDSATIAFSRDPNAYLPSVLTRYEGVEVMNYSPFIYALDERDVAITGRGTLDGQADETHWHGGVVIGSEVSGGARNIFAERCRMDSPRLDRALRFKTNATRGGTIERVAMRQITVGQVAEAIVAADFYYEEGDTGAFTPVLRDVDIRDVTSRRSKYAFLLRGYARSPVTDVRVSDCTFDGVESPDVLEGVRDLVLTNVRINGRVRTERISR